MVWKGGPHASVPGILHVSGLAMTACYMGTIHGLGFHRRATEYGIARRAPSAICPRHNQPIASPNSFPQRCRMNSAYLWNAVRGDDP